MRSLDLPEAETKFWGLATVVAVDMKVESDLRRIVLDPSNRNRIVFFMDSGGGFAEDCTQKKLLMTTNWQVEYVCFAAKQNGQ